MKTLSRFFAVALLAGSSLLAVPQQANAFFGWMMPWNWFDDGWWGDDYYYPYYGYGYGPYGWGNPYGWGGGPYGYPYHGGYGYPYYGGFPYYGGYPYYAPPVVAAPAPAAPAASTESAKDASAQQRGTREMSSVRRGIEGTGETPRKALVPCQLCGVPRLLCSEADARVETGPGGGMR